MTTDPAAPAAGHHDRLLPPAPPAARDHVRAVLGPALDGMLRPPPPPPPALDAPPGGLGWDPDDRRRWQAVTAHRLHTDANALHAAAHDLASRGPLSAADAVAAVLARHVPPVPGGRPGDSLLHLAAGPLLAAWSAQTAAPPARTGLKRPAARAAPADRLVDTRAAHGDLVAAGDWVRAAARAVQARPAASAARAPRPLPPLDPGDPLLAQAGGPGPPPDPGAPLRR